jgi:hypothetical protein
MNRGLQGVGTSFIVWGRSFLSLQKHNGLGAKGGFSDSLEATLTKL